MNYPRGSEWRKWDLHVHTPYTFLNNRFNCSDDEFINKMKEEKLCCIALTNYFKFKEEEFNLAEKIVGSREIKVFLNLELRLDYQNKEDDCLDFHIIFDFNSNTKDVINKLLYNLDVNVKGINKKAIDLDGEDFKFAVVNYDHLLTQLNSEALNIGNFLCGFLSRGKGNARSSSNYEKIAFNSDFIIHSSDNLRNLEEDRKFWLQYKKPVLQNSDAHTLEDVGKKFTWIKADPTFEGLKQVIYEPEDRIRIQDTNPYEDFSKQVFSNIKIKETKIFNDENVRFKQQEIPLNSNLVTIIGGRGSGKSLLLDCIAKVFNKTNKRAEEISIENDNFIVEFTKFDGIKENYNIQNENELDYLHIYQGYVKEIVDPKEKNQLDLEIKKLLNIREIIFSKSESEILQLIDEIFEIKNFLLKTDENGKKINSKDYIQKEIDKRQKLIENITTEQNRELINQYTRNVKTINLYTQRKNFSNKFKVELNNFQRDKNEIIYKINKNIEVEDNKIPPIIFNEQIEKIDFLIEFYEIEIKELNEINIKIKEDFSTQGIKGDITTLLEQTKNYQDEIDKLNEKLKEVENKENRLNEKFKNIEELISFIEEDYNNYKDEINNNWLNLKNGKEGWSKEQKELINKLLENIEIETEEIFDVDEFYSQLFSSGVLNMMKFRATRDKNSEERIKDFFNIRNKNDYKKFLKNESLTQEGITFKNLIDSDYFNKEGAREFLKLLILNFTQYWKVITKPKYKNKELHQLSVGMKGTMFLCIKLSTDPFMKPFVFDQPEDDLDNNFIVNELVPVFKEIKKYRQVIIVTHNANLVVNADAEQVIIAKNEDEELEYISGSIENPIIREEICNILEGGKEAFEKRKSKYDF